MYNGRHPGGKRGGDADGGGGAGVPEPAAAGDDIVFALPAPVQGNVILCFEDEI